MRGMRKCFTHQRQHTSRETRAPDTTHCSTSRERYHRKGNNPTHETGGVRSATPSDEHFFNSLFNRHHSLFSSSSPHLDGSGWGVCVRERRGQHVQQYTVRRVQRNAMELREEVGDAVCVEQPPPQLHTLTGGDPIVTSEGWEGNSMGLSPLSWL